MSEKFVIRTINLNDLREDAETVLNLLVYNPLTKPLKVSVNVIEKYVDSPKVFVNDCQFEVELDDKQIKMVNCSLSPITYGSTKLIVQAKNLADNQSLAKYQQNIRINAKGVRKSDFKHVLVDLDMSSDSYSFKHTWHYPVQILPGTQRLFIIGNMENSENTWYSKLLSNANLKDYKIDITQTECDHKMPRLFSHVSALKFLNAARQLAPEQTKQIADEFNIACGKTPYDGSIVSQTFKGNVSNDPGIKSSTWMTAQYLKSMKDFSKINNNYQNGIYFTSSWLKKRELFTGEVLETDPDLMRRPNSINFGIHLTAFVYIALASDMNFIEPESEMIGYLSKQYDHLDSNYDKVISCYAFTLAQHPLGRTCFNEILQKMKTVPDKGYKFCPDNDGKPDIEASSYCLLIMVKNQYYSIALDFYNYIHSVQTKENTIGDQYQTALAFDGMAELVQIAQKHRDAKNEIQVTIDDQPAMKLSVESKLNQVFEMSLNTSLSKVDFNGYGKANIFFAMKYNTIDSVPDSNVTYIEICKP